jgi:glycine cleavage system H lipoate-binding protein
MSSGIINYKLCNCQFQCETCAFDKVMLLQNKNHVAQEANLIAPKQTKIDNITVSRVNEYLSYFLSDFKIHFNRFYHPSHFWYQTESDHTVIVGMNKLFLKILKPFQELKLPEVGEEYNKGQPIFFLIREEMTMPLHSAFNGKIIEINGQLKGGGIEQNSEDDPYYFKMEVENLRREIEHLCTTICGLKYFIDLISLLKKYLHQTFRLNQSNNSIKSVK